MRQKVWFSLQLILAKKKRPDQDVKYLLLHAIQAGFIWKGKCHNNKSVEIWNSSFKNEDIYWKYGEI